MNDIKQKAANLINQVKESVPLVHHITIISLPMTAQTLHSQLVDHP